MGSAETGPTIALVSDTFPHRHKDTGKVQDLTPEAAAVFGDTFERLPEGFETMTDEQIAAHAKLDAALDEGSERTKAAREAKAEVEKADSAAETKDA